MNLTSPFDLGIERKSSPDSSRLALFLFLFLFSIHLSLVQLQIFHFDEFQSKQTLLYTLYY